MRVKGKTNNYGTYKIPVINTENMDEEDVITYIKELDIYQEELNYRVFKGSLKGFKSIFIIEDLLDIISLKETGRPFGNYFDGNLKMPKIIELNTYYQDYIKKTSNNDLENLYDNLTNYQLKYKEITQEKLLGYYLLELQLKEYIKQQYL